MLAWNEIMKYVIRCFEQRPQNVLNPSQPPHPHTYIIHKTPAQCTIMKRAGTMRGSITKGKRHAITRQKC